jgi:hypothetical protein
MASAVRHPDFTETVEKMAKFFIVAALIEGAYP